MRGGTNARTNLAAAHLHCNQHRGHQMNLAKMRKDKAKGGGIIIAAQQETFTDKEVEDYLRRKRSGFIEEPQKLDCIHCGNSYPAHEGAGGLCDYCLHRD
ncbi:hypothetical protein FJ987_26575 [Mesorhizobium sp. CU2]|uniref:hypothetical protein n=1 Tax=unclassified Mesorhizobium TaxID=325217 RepID=UPI00112AB75F|nr:MULTISPECIES: hypothetical protein [unclassified Mesorhizobium]TPN80796.1 hypothetical protein FJ988_20125 [Mesorhizobium sp. CU3]TPO04960.1 hypothetical protein FJ987_26575 [Mesorhizobium sp. CU2]